MRAVDLDGGRVVAPDQAGLSTLADDVCPGSGLPARPPAGWGRNRWSGRRDSNPRPTAWKAVTLPLSYSRSGSSLHPTRPADDAHVTVTDLPAPPPPPLRFRSGTNLFSGSASGSGSGSPPLFRDPRPARPTGHGFAPSRKPAPAGAARTTEAIRRNHDERSEEWWRRMDSNHRRAMPSRFTVCPLWPLGYASKERSPSRRRGPRLLAPRVEPAPGIEPGTYCLQDSCSTPELCRRSRPAAEGRRGRRL